MAQMFFVAPATPAFLEERPQSTGRMSVEEHEHGHKLFVGNLPTDCTSEELRAVFSTYGTVTHVHVMNPHPRTGQRCAFVFYDTKSAGDDACKVLDQQYKIRSDASEPIVVRWSKDTAKLWKHLKHMGGHVRSFREDGKGKFGKGPQPPPYGKGWSKGTTDAGMGSILDGQVDI
eukprot:Skav228053  [mRNA]  locus=scaffold1188:236390:244750:+ [translate_table: standard]